MNAHAQHIDTDMNACVDNPSTRMSMGGGGNPSTGRCALHDAHTAPGAHCAGLTFTVGEVVSAGNTRVTPQPRHTGPAAALPAAGVAGCMQGALGRAVAGWGRKRVWARGETHLPPGLPQGYSRAQVGKPWKPGLHSWQVVPV